MKEPVAIGSVGEKISMKRNEYAVLSDLPITQGFLLSIASHITLVAALMFFTLFDGWLHLHAVEPVTISLCLLVDGVPLAITSPLLYGLRFSNSAVSYAILIAITIPTFLFEVVVWHAFVFKMISRYFEKRKMKSLLQNSSALP